ncbi:jg15443 [Pararge aegeria aegeria]|uniref:Jg15443 protein n=1 Tax=Pararge aegeria aegeria TaxID=348720 RepID=A0A8S4S692_9NEOP|nr:jg15443 [Pararge aegeria aegeria]
MGLITGQSSLNRHLSITGVTDSPLRRACMEADETPTHVMLECTGVAERREVYLRSPATLPEVLGNLGGMLSFWKELGWLEQRVTSGKFRRTTSDVLTFGNCSEKKKKNHLPI